MSTIQAIMAELQAGEAAQARIPELERALQDAQAKLFDSQRHAQELELRAKLRDDTISMLTQKAAKLTEERDDASFRVLEAEDRLSTFEKAVGNAWGGLGNAINALRPPKAVEPVEVKAEAKQDPTPVNVAPSSTEVLAANAGTAIVQSDPGQSESNPTVYSIPAPDAQPGAVQSQAAGSQESVLQPDPWTPKVEMPEVKAEAEQYKPFDQPPAKPWEPSF